MVCTKDLKKRITIEQEVEVADGGGGFVKTWETFAEVWAFVDNLSGLRNLRGGDKFLYEKINNQIIYKFVLRNRTDLSTDMRILYKSTYYNIRSILENEENGPFMEVFAERGVAA